MVVISIFGDLVVTLFFSKAWKLAISLHRSFGFFGENFSFVGQPFSFLNNATPSLTQKIRPCDTGLSR